MVYLEKRMDVEIAFEIDFEMVHVSTSMQLMSFLVLQHKID